MSNGWFVMLMVWFAIKGLDAHNSLAVLSSVLANLAWRCTAMVMAIHSAVEDYRQTKRFRTATPIPITPEIVDGICSAIRRKQALFLGGSMLALVALAVFARSATYYPGIPLLCMVAALWRYYAAGRLISASRRSHASCELRGPGILVAQGGRVFSIRTPLAERWRLSQLRDLDPKTAREPRVPEAGLPTPSA